MPANSEGAALEHDAFVTLVLSRLAESLQDLLGLDDASGLVSIVGQDVGREIGLAYRKALALPRLDAEQLAAVMVDLKRRIRGDFYLISQDDEKIVLGARTCPFGRHVLGRPTLCMMTSNMFGVIVSENVGYARVDIENAIARGAPGCRIVIHLRPPEEHSPEGGREYFGS